jgi:hypothetical protein
MKTFEVYAAVANQIMTVGIRAMTMCFLYYGTPQPGSGTCEKKETSMFTCASCAGINVHRRNTLDVSLRDF